MTKPQPIAPNQSQRPTPQVSSAGLFIFYPTMAIKEVLQVNLEGGSRAEVYTTGCRIFLYFPEIETKVELNEHDATDLGNALLMVAKKVEPANW